MKRIVWGLTMAVVLVSCSGVDQKKEEKMEEEVKPLVSKNSDTFNLSFEKLLSAYQQLTNALVEYDTTAANTAAFALNAAAQGLSVNGIQGDSTGAIKETAASYTATIGTSATDLIAAKDLTQKKRQYQGISDALFDLARTVRYDKEKLYRQHCPMAFNDEEQAYWISSSRVIVNPYLGKKHPKYKAAMLDCGDVADSLDYH